MENNQDSEKIPVLTLIQKIKDGSISPKSLSKEERQECVEILYADGYSESAIAQILIRSDKTIRRDLMDIRKKNAISPDRNLARELVGEMLQKARMHQSRLMRIAGNRDYSTAERIQAERASWLIEKELIEKLQSLGYMPLRPQELVLTQESKEDSIEEIDQTLLEIEQITQDDPNLMAGFKETIDAIRAKRDVVKLNLEAQKLLEQKKSFQKEAENAE